MALRGWHKSFLGEVAESLPAGTLCFFPSIAGERVTELFLENQNAIRSLLQKKMGEMAPSCVEVVSFPAVSKEDKISLLSLYFPDRSESDVAALCDSLDWSRLDDAPHRKFGNCSLVLRDGSSSFAWGCELSDETFWTDLQNFPETSLPSLGKACPSYKHDSQDVDESASSPKQGKLAEVYNSLKSKFRKESAKRSSQSFSKECQDFFPLEEPLCEEESASPSQSEDTARQKAERIRNEIVSLQREHGIDVLVDVFGQDILQILKRIPRPKLSRLQVTDDYRIFLTDYNNREISVGALEKSLYFLFLLHPEGIRLKDLDAYERPLMEIYKMVSNREDLTKMQGSIADLVEPGSALCQQKLARVRAAFRKWMNVDLEVEYTPNGKRGERYSVRLDRSLLSLPESLLALK